MEGTNLSERSEEPPTIAFSGFDSEGARRVVRALEQVGVRTDNIETVVDAEVDGGEALA